MSEIVVTTEGAIGHIHLNRPMTINALTPEMVHNIAKALDQFANASEIAAVLVTGAGKRGLCAGGDIRALYEHRASGPEFGMAFFRDEYRLNAQIAKFPKPYIAFMNGITMGGGVGISSHGSVRIVTETTKLAMPETGIGFFPDIGASWMLSHGPGEVGTYLALTGQIIDGADAIFSGLADYFIESTHLPALREELTTLPRTASPEDMHSLARKFAQPLAAPLAQHKEEIDECFHFNDAKQIVSALEKSGTSFAQQTLETLKQKSPTGMQVALRLLRQAKTSDTLKTCLQREYDACEQVLRSDEFYEGIRAAVIDKDRRPNWNPASLDEVTEAVIASYFFSSKTHIF
ncbi:enoyl-CoA hydratase/isomerase family protein [Acidocella aminolytica]|uniref:3-hydroxyisobutyryl-CoA hydrolase n=1 Tax=Acidocella aminolytica 101 = DSM 11237 TaxID=1120923 RepID=A0A0D6PDH9_9PROT|nr:enoyl-CoA hydratase/isomerase family protein [Acidocella aminolytica]GAN79253.1 3-hydroxyisobutyryl-CoA hydrolase/enoyl-CoA hydratase [Acidocella aminolytica 101 = DSM 11237]GBQ39729.1 enoyl-CoA hydratase [Acidocella aminolytica 101 = DSM 11237]SHE36842.1 enoyl-CoA hydratase [Acidocella aminolytica 101 = DSM 11237]